MIALRQKVRPIQDPAHPRVERHQLLQILTHCSSDLHFRFSPLSGPLAGPILLRRLPLSFFRHSQLHVVIIPPQNRHIPSTGDERHKTCGSSHGRHAGCRGPWYTEEDRTSALLRPRWHKSHGHRGEHESRRHRRRAQKPQVQGMQGGERDEKRRVEIGCDGKRRVEA